MIAFVKLFFGEKARKERALKKEMRRLKLRPQRPGPDGEPNPFPDTFLADPPHGHNLGG